MLRGRRPGVRNGAENCPWVRRHKSTSLVKLFVLTPFGRVQDMRLLLDLFPEARIEVLLARRHTVETEMLSSPRIQIRPTDRDSGTRRRDGSPSVGRVRLPLWRLRESNVMLDG